MARAGVQVSKRARGRRPLLRLLSSWVALHTTFTLSERPVCCPSAGTKDRVLTRLPGGRTVGAPDRPPALSFLPLAFLVLWETLREGNRSLPAGARPQECVQSLDHVKWARVPSRKGLSAWTPSRERQRAGMCKRRLLEPAGMESVASGWRCRGLRRQLAGGAVALCHNLVLSPCGGLAAAGPWGE